MLHKLVYYAQFLTAEQLNNACGYYGYLLELAIKDYFGKPLVISPEGKIDISVSFNGKLRRAEIKQNGGQFRSAGKGNSLMFYSVYIEPEKTLPEQLGYIMPMELFRSVGFSLKHIRTEKLDGDGYRIMALQTLYNYSKSDFHGAKAGKLADTWEDGGAVTFKSFFKK